MINFKNYFNLTGYEVYIIGGNGLIGSQILTALEQFGAKITIFDLDIKGKKSSLKTKYVKFDCGNEKKMKNFFINYIKKNKLHQKRQRTDHRSRCHVTVGSRHSTEGE